MFTFIQFIQETVVEAPFLLATSLDSVHTTENQQAEISVLMGITF
jgi:hypothetical protein